MTGVISADGTKASKEEGVFLIGTTLEITDLNAFREEYFRVTKDFCAENSICETYPVIKSEHLSKNIPSFKFASQREKLIEDLVSIDEISNIHITACFYNEDVLLPKNDETTSGIQFLTNILAQYFSQVSVWSYLESNRSYLKPQKKLLIDNFEGKLTRSWMDVSNFFNDIDVVPKGDLTYPSISTADLIANFVGRTFEAKKMFKENNTEFLEYPIRDEAEGYVSSSLLGPEAEDMIVPFLPFQSKPHHFYPHPIYFIYENCFDDNDVVTTSSLHQKIRKEVYKKEGCTKFLNFSGDAYLFREGDKIIYTGREKEKLSTFQVINSDMDIDVISVKDFNSNK